MVGEKMCARVVRPEAFHRTNRGSLAAKPVLGTLSLHIGDNSTITSALLAEEPKASRNFP